MDHDIIYKSKELRKDEHFLKIMVVGRACTGNTSMLKRFLYNQFDASTRLTVGVQFFTAKLKLLEKDVTIQFWDFAGEERWNSFQPYFYTSLESMMIVFDLSWAITLDNIEYFIESAKKVGIKLNQILLVGNKSDLTDHIEITDEFALKLVEVYNLHSYVKTSAKTGFKINYAFKLAALISMFNRKLIDKPELNSYINKL